MEGATVMAGTTRYPVELRERAVAMYRASEPKPVIRQMARQLGVHPEALRNWIRQDEADQGERRERLSTPEREAGPAAHGKPGAAARERDSQGGERLFRGPARPDRPAVLRFVDEHREAFGVEPVLREIGIKSSTFHDWRMRAARPSARAVRDGRLIHHADHGSQYTSIKLTTRLLKAGVKASMGTVGDSFDNALAENFWSVLKTECVRRTSFPTRADADLALFEYIDGFYSTRRIQKRLGWLSPDEYEAAWHADREGRPQRHGLPLAPPADRSHGHTRDHPAPPGTASHTANQASPNRRTASTPETRPNR
jgi:transposase InsO family protein